MFDCILLMAGKGLRTNLDYNKTLYLVNDQPLFMYSLNEFLKLKECRFIVIVTSDENIDYVREKVALLGSERITVTLGGTTRQESVFNGLQLTNSDYVLIHDAARPFIKTEDILKVYQETKSYNSAVLAVPVKDTIKIASDGFVTQTLERSNLFAVQTPQGVKRDLFEYCINKAKDNNYTGTDDVELIEKFSNTRVKIVLGSDENIKITTPKDLQTLKNLEGE